MITQEDLYILKVAHQEGILNRVQIQECLNLCREEGVPLRKKLIEEVIFTSKKWTDLRKKAMELPGFPHQISYIQWENLFLWKNFSASYLPEELEKLSTLYEFAQQTADSFLSILLITRVIPPEEFEKHLGIENNLLMACVKCGFSSVVTEHFPWRKYPCPLCEGELGKEKKEPAPAPLPQIRSAPESTSKQLIHRAVSRDGPSKKMKKIIKTWGRYNLLKVLGKGGYGLVYEAHDTKLDRVVALKVLSMMNVKAASLIRFQREMHLLEKLQHPNIVSVYDWGEMEGKPYFSMDYIEGTNLWNYVQKQGKLEEKNALQIFLEILKPVEFAHSQGIVHRDIKPENVLMSKPGKIYLMDFGLAKDLLDFELSLTDTGMILGTPDFMSPEQARGERTIGVEADIFALGGVLYFLLTASPPFLDPNAYEVFRKLLEEDPPSLREIRPDLSEDIDRVVRRCMEKDPKNRYPQASLLRQEIIHILKEKFQVQEVPLEESKSEQRRPSLPYKRLSLLFLLFFFLVVLLFIPEVQRSIYHFWKAHEQPKPGEVVLLPDGPSSEDPILIKPADYYKQALSFWKKKKDSQAWGDIEQALRLDPKYGEAYGLRGFLYLSKKDFARAKEDFQKNLFYKPDSPYGYAGLAVLKIREGDFKDALVDLEQALALNPNFGPAYKYRGIAYFKIGEWREALQNLEEVKKIEMERDTETEYYLGLSKVHQNKKEEALGHFTLALPSENPFLSAFYERGKIYWGQGKKKEARADWEEYVKRFPQAPEKKEIEKYLGKLKSNEK